MKKDLPDVTLIIVDCVDYDRARKSFDRCKEFFNFGDAKFLTHFDVDSSDVVKIDEINSLAAYSVFMLKRLWQYVNTSHALIVQWDGTIWNPNLWSDEFLEYDYIGAPWSSELIGVGIPKQFNVGNGGFSLRSKRLIDFVALNDKIIIHSLEDVAICQYNRAYLECFNFKFAPYDVAYKFSWESGNPPVNGAFGVHKRMTCK